MILLACAALVNGRIRPMLGDCATSGNLAQIKELEPGRDVALGALR